MTKHDLPHGLRRTARGGRAETIYRSIFEAVVERRLPPGAKLAEEQLGAIFQASRTIVRSALQDLAHDHIVAIERHRGAFVSAPTIADAQDVFFSRKLLESAIAREAARRLRPSDAARLRRMLEQEADALKRGNRERAIRLSGEFHLAIAGLCGEGALTQFLRSLISRSSLVIALYGRGQASECGHADHAALLEALAAGDPERAAAAMAEHIDHVVADLALVEHEAEPVELAEILRP